MLQGGLDPAGIHFGCPATAFALQMVMVVPGITADEAHDLVGAKDAFSPALPHEPLEIAVDRGQP